MKKSEILKILDWRVKSYHVEKYEDGKDILVINVSSLSFLNRKIFEYILIACPRNEKTIEVSFNSSVIID